MSVDKTLPTATETVSCGVAATEYTHPSFAMIKRNVYQGTCNLFGTNVEENSFIEIEISTAHLSHRLNSDWYHSDKPVLLARMSKMQWADFISTSNGNGTPITLTHVADGQPKRLPLIDGSFNLRHQIEDDAARLVTQALSSIQSVLDGLLEQTESKGAISKPKLRELHNQLKTATSNLPQNLKYTVECALSDIEKAAKTVALNAKVEIEQHAQSKGYTLTEANQLGFMDNIKQISHG